MLDHPGILDLQQTFSVNNDILLLVNELIEGNSVFKKIQASKTAMNELDTFQIVNGILEIIKYTQEIGIILLNLNPFNILYEHPSINDCFKIINYATAVQIPDDVKSIQNLYVSDDTVEPCLSFKGQSTKLYSLS